MKMKLAILLWTCCLLPIASFAEEAPEPEFPYPKSRKQKFDVEAPESVESNGAYQYSTKKKNTAPTVLEGLEQPTGMASDGSYIYEPKADKNPASIDGVEKPIDSDDEGGYYYRKDKSSKKDKIRKVIGEKPSTISDDGSYLYDMKIPEAKHVFSFRGGVYGPPDIKPTTVGARSYRDVYSSSSSFVFTADYDWKLFGDVFLKVGSGIISANGRGQFVGGANGDLSPREKFQLFMFPNTASLSYRFQLWNIQYLTPYVDGGAGYFTFAEIRSDGKNTRFGGAPVLTATAGMLISVSKFQHGSSLQTDYGISQSWIDVQYRQIIGLDSRKDFSSNMISAGFAVGF